MIKSFREGKPALPFLNRKLLFPPFRPGRKINLPPSFIAVLYPERDDCDPGIPSKERLRF
jgi:hypothetical protein